MVSCSAGDPVQPETGGPGSGSADSQLAPPDDGSAGQPDQADAGNDVAAAAPDSTGDVAPTETALLGPVLVVGEDDIVEIVELAAGDQHTDAQGNLVVIYGIANWPDAVDQLPASARSAFSFADDLDALGDSALDLVAIDIGMCGAGIGLDETGSTGFGTAEFFVHESPTAPFSRDPVLDRALVTSHPIVGSGFEFPAAATCARGWLPVLRADEAQSGVARYVLTNRTSSTAPIERHIYQWQIDQATDIGTTSGQDSGLEAESFGIGQTVTFNEGSLDGTTVVVDGWSEIIGAQTALEGTRLVAVSLSFCPSTLQLPDFGLAVDGWNLVAVDSGSDLLGASTAGDPTQGCFDGWLRFAVPFGAVPTGFFASDGANADTGYAFWELDGAALPAPDE